MTSPCSSLWSGRLWGQRGRGRESAWGQHCIKYFSFPPNSFFSLRIHLESLHYQSVFVEDETRLQPVQPESESEVKSLVQTVVVDYQEQWSLISFERKNAKERNRQCKDEDRKGENYLGYAKIVAKWQVLGCMDQNCLKDILERTWSHIFFFWDLILFFSK